MYIFLSFISCCCTQNVRSLPAAIFNHFSHFLFKNYSVCRLLLLHEIKNISDSQAEPQAEAPARAEGPVQKGKCQVQESLQLLQVTRVPLAEEATYVRSKQQTLLDYKTRAGAAEVELEVAFGAAMKVAAGESELDVNLGAAAAGSGLILTFMMEA